MTSNPCAKKATERYLTSHEETRLAETMKDDLDLPRLPLEVSLNTSMRKNIELLKLKVEHLNFNSRPVFFPIHRVARRDIKQLAYRGQGKERQVSLEPDEQ